MSPKLNHINLGEVQKIAYLHALVVKVDGGLDTMDFTGLDLCPSAVDIPIFYHCDKDSIQRNNGALEGAAGAFAKDDEVIVQCKVINSTEYEPLYVIGFVGKPKMCIKPWVYFIIYSEEGDDVISSCVLWDPVKNAYAIINDPITGNPVVYPCSVETIQFWLDDTESVAEGLWDRIEAGEDLIPFGETSVLSANTGCGEFYNTFVETGGHDCGDFFDPCSWGFHTEYDFKARTDRLASSFNLVAANESGASSCIRTALKNESDRNGSWTGSGGNYDEGYNWEQETNVHTPIGMVFEAEETKETWEQTINDEVGTLIRTAVEEDWFEARYMCCSKIMVQVYYGAVLKAESIGSDYYRDYIWCVSGWPAWYADAGERVISETNRVEGLAASCNVYDDTKVIDPSTQEKNADFQSAINTAIANYYSAAGIGGDALPPSDPYGVSTAHIIVDIRE